MSDYEFIGYEPVQGSDVVVITLNRPEKLNAISSPLATELADAFHRFDQSDAFVAVLTGAGRAFTAGMDLQEYFRDNEGKGLGAVRKAQSEAYGWWRRLRWYQKPTIAMVNGWCFGGAFNSMIACDLAIAAEDATFGLSEINWGIIPAGTVTKAVASVMGQRDTMYYIMTGETFDGRKAASMGLVNEAVPRAELRARVQKLAATLIEKNPMALRIAKHAARRVRDMSWEDAEDYLFAKLDQLRFLDPEKGREKGMTQFLDDKSYRPGLAAYRRDS